MNPVSREALTFLLTDSGARALALARAAGFPPAVADVTRLQRTFGAELARAALEVAGARSRGGEKFGPRAGMLIADRVGVEQASSLRSARWKARRFASLPNASAVVDVGCGIGGDAMGFRDTGLRVLGIDRDPSRAWMCAHNAGITCAVADAAGLEVAGRVVHVDPARRAEGRRLWRLEEFEPAPDVLRRLVTSARAAAVKLGPGLDRESWPLDAEWEWISEAGRLVQAVAWHGELAEADARASVLGPPDATLARPRGRAAAPIPTEPLARFVHEIDPAVERARLIGELCELTGLAALHPRLGLLTSGARADSPFLRSFEVLREQPWSLRRVRERLRELDAGEVTVKTRGRAAEDAAGLARTLRGSGSRPLEVFVLRDERRRFALIAERCRPE